MCIRDSSQGLPVYTLNPSDFEGIEGLMVVTVRHLGDDIDRGPAPAPA